MASDWDGVSEKTKAKINAKTNKIAGKILSKKDEQNRE